eukprot:7001232-Pyramimonas_sp.AAC.1
MCEVLIPQGILRPSRQSKRTDRCNRLYLPRAAHEQRGRQRGSRSGLVLRKYPTQRGFSGRRPLYTEHLTMCCKQWIGEWGSRFSVRCCETPVIIATGWKAPDILTN